MSIPTPLLKAVLPFFLTVLFAAPKALAQERAPVLKGLLTRGKAAQIKALSQRGLYPEPVEHLTFSKSDGTQVLSFDYVRLESTEWFFNVKASAWEAPTTVVMPV